MRITKAVQMRMCLRDSSGASNRKPTLPKDNSEVQDKASSSVHRWDHFLLCQLHASPLRSNFWIASSLHQVQQPRELISPVVPPKSLEVSPLCLDSWLGSRARTRTNRYYQRSALIGLV